KRDVLPFVVERAIWDLADRVEAFLRPNYAYVTYIVLLPFGHHLNMLNNIIHMINATSKEKFHRNIWTTDTIGEEKEKSPRERYDDKITSVEGNELRSSLDDKKALKTIKQFEDIIAKKTVNLTELRHLAWNGVPFGMLYYTILSYRD